jgi:uncharacterized protein YcbK (DUF882 family)
MTDQKDLQLLDRRSLLLTAAKIAAGLIIASPLELLARPIPDNTISFFHTHTGEHLELCLNNGTCSPLAKKNLCTFLRDFRTGDVHPIDYRLIDILQNIQRETGSKGIFEVISGYRSPRTNSLLRSRSKGVAKKSFHLKGRAIDIRLSDVPTKELRDVALSLKAGGVGYYAQSNFVHVDTGSVRFW